MRVRVLAAAVALATAGLGTAIAVGSTSGPSLEGTVREDGFTSKALQGRLRFAVYLPPGYGAGTRYPVVYYLHGLPATGSAFLAFGFVPATLEARHLRAIVVAPQGARDGDSDPEYLDRGPGRNWETAIAEELPAYIDAHYRTIPGRDGRALIGLSAGGYGAFLLTLHHLGTFAVVESWSGYFHPTDPSGTKPLRLGSGEADARASAHTLVASLRTSIRRRPTLLAFYVGSADSRFRAENVRLHRELAQARVPHVFRLYPGGHSPLLWQNHAADWLALAMSRLDRPTKG